MQQVCAQNFQILLIFHNWTSQSLGYFSSMLIFWMRTTSKMNKFSVECGIKKKTAKPQARSAPSSHPSAGVDCLPSNPSIAYRVQSCGYNLCLRSTFSLCSLTLLSAPESIMQWSGRTRSVRAPRPPPSCKFQSGRNLIVRLQHHQRATYHGYQRTAWPLIELLNLNCITQPTAIEAVATIIEEKTWRIRLFYHYFYFYC